MLESYLSTKTSQDKAYIARLRRRISESIEIFNTFGVTNPTGIDYDRLREQLSSKPGKRYGTKLSVSVIDDWVNATKDFYLWKAGREQMTNEQQASIEEKVEVKRGRRTKPDAERRSEKLSVYLTPDIYNSMKALAAVSMQDMSDIFFMLASEFVERNSDKLAAAQNFLSNIGDIR